MNKKDKESEISLHTSNLNHKFDENCYVVLDREKNWLKARISESLHIKMLHNTINKQSNSFKINNVYDSVTHLFHF